jgi:hypothetical protein
MCICCAALSSFHDQSYPLNQLLSCMTSALAIRVLQIDVAKPEWLLHNIHLNFPYKECLARCRSLSLRCNIPCIYTSDFGSLLSPQIFNQQLPLSSSTTDISQQTSRNCFLFVIVTIVQWTVTSHPKQPQWTLERSIGL